MKANECACPSRRGWWWWSSSSSSTSTSSSSSSLEQEKHVTVTSVGKASRSNATAARGLVADEICRSFRGSPSRPRGSRRRASTNNLSSSPTPLAAISCPPWRCRPVAGQLPLSPPLLPRKLRRPVMLLTRRLRVNYVRSGVVSIALLDVGVKKQEEMQKTRQQQRAETTEDPGLEAGKTKCASPTWNPRPNETR